MGAMAARCVALGSECVEVLLARETPMDLSTLPAHAKEWLDMDPAALSETMAQILTEIPETERLFDMTLLDTDSCTAILEQARELLLVRNLKAIEEVSALQQSSDYFRERAADFEDKNRRDPLTGVFNRGHMEQVLEKEFQSAIAGGWPLSIVFVDLDDFKKVNDTHGHAAGDTVLMGIAKLILDVVRDTDYVVRYGGDEFLMIFPGIGLAEAQKVCERLLARLRSTHYTFATGGLTVTTSLGLASHSPNSPYRSVAQLIEAADRSVYLAKAAGRDQLISHESPILARTA
jgi:diguanylate cyclase (GGDEF)-like protein